MKIDLLNFKGLPAYLYHYVPIAIGGIFYLSSIIIN